MTCSLLTTTGQPSPSPVGGHTPSSFSEVEADDEQETGEDLHGKKHSLAPLSLGHAPSETEADDELERDPTNKRAKPPTKRSHLRGLLNKKNAERDAKRMQSVKALLSPQTPQTPETSVTPETPMTLQTLQTPQTGQ